MHTRSIQCERALILKYNFLMNLNEDIYCTMGFSGGSDSKESTCNAGDLGLIPVLGRSPGEGNGYPFHYSGLENSVNFIVHGAAKSRTRLSNFHFHFH